ncbi:unnamed protein product [Brachionus calyciflorus]|uniref:Uncharacterized protein n=1 Tax=Brachionus calyciflorus TaxID=104777 RepID=A0A814FW49_9BILA|nr:unnamed protein product [Brachionus calyciflorus]
MDKHEVKTLKEILEKEEEYDQAARKIQRFWRKYIDLQVFKYYKDLVVFHNEGDPAIIMKFINPNEAKLIDPASGIHIKFRLAGHQFPPTIHYKIYTHRPVQDICANAPRDYTKPSYKMKPAQIKNNREKNFPVETFEGWYQRFENNGWRPVSNKHLVQMNLDYYYGIEKNSKPVVFYHSKLLRKKDIELRKKQKKIEWMKKLYMKGMLKPSGDDDETNQMIEKATKNFLQAYNMNGIENIADWEVDELVNWTNTLNYDDYYKDWKTIGTTAHSEKLIVEEKRLKERMRFEDEHNESVGINSINKNSLTLEVSDSNISRSGQSEDY